MRPKARAFEIGGQGAKTNAGGRLIKAPERRLCVEADGETCGY